MTLLAIDIGTTHCKAGLFAADGTVLKIASLPTVAQRAPEGWSYYDPEELWQTVVEVLSGVTAAASHPIAAVGIASMAETGLLVDSRTGEARSFLVPWFDTASQPQANLIGARSDPLERYIKTGTRVSFKCSLAKLLWLREQDIPTERTIWLSMADYIAFRLTGKFGTDYSLAGYTFAFRVDTKEWDDDWLRGWGLSRDIFPPARPSGTLLGQVKRGNILPSGIPVAVCGHDHVCGALAMGVTQPGEVFDSMGTAETLIGALPERTLTEADFHLGLLYGCHVARERGYWLGSLSASGGSIEWIRSLLGPKPISYADIDALLATACPAPTGILYFPYLVGSGYPHLDPQARGAFIGLSASHRQEDLVKAVLEGTAYELEFIRQVGEQMTGLPISTLITGGGGTRNRTWLQIKADISGRQLVVCAKPEATLLGAALVAGIGCGLYADDAEALAALTPCPVEIYSPDKERHALYRRSYEQGFLALQEPLKAYYNRE